MRLIGLVGYKRVGKTTAAQYFYEKRLYLEYAFADPIKRMVDGLFSNPNSKSDQLLKSLYKTAKIDKDAELSMSSYSTFSLRKLYQLLGTEFGRHLMGEDFWIGFADLQYQYWDSANVAGMVVSDVRFENEARWILSKPDSCLIDLHRGRTVIDLHESEQYHTWIEKYPHKVVSNFGTVKELHEQLEKF